jgi:AcrR family transcriptional regulator
MGRWEPNAQGRLGQAAMELYAERGFDQTTVADIAERAGLTKRTFFRHFADKREVLFGGADALRALVVQTIAEAPAGLSPVALVTRGLETGAAAMQERPEEVRVRQAVIATRAELQERALINFATLAQEMAAALQKRGVDPWPAQLVAEAGMATFRVALARWLANQAERPLTEVVDESMAELARTIAAG